VQLVTTPLSFPMAVGIMADLMIGRPDPVPCILPAPEDRSEQLIGNGFKTHVGPAVFRRTTAG
jgi:hypothetical protein